MSEENNLEYWRQFDIRYSEIGQPYGPTKNPHGSNKIYLDLKTVELGFRFCLKRTQKEISVEWISRNNEQGREYLRYMTSVSKYLRWPYPTPLLWDVRADRTSFAKVEVTQQTHSENFEAWQDDYDWFLEYLSHFSDIFADGIADWIERGGYTDNWMQER